MYECNCHFVFQGKKENEDLIIHGGLESRRRAA